MAKGFLLTAQLQLAAPTQANVNQVIASLKNNLKAVDIPINVAVNPSQIKAVQTLTKSTSALSKEVAVAEDSFYKFGAASALAAKRFLAFVVSTSGIIGLARAFASSAKEAIDFQHEMVKIAQVTNKTLSGVKSLTEEVDRLSVGLGVSSNKLLEATQVLAQAGLSVDDTKKSLEALAKSAVSPTFDDLIDTTEGAVAIFSQFKIRAEQLEGALGSINAVAGKFAVESGDIITAVRRTGGAFKAAGGDLNELAALFTSVRATTRESAESIATGFRTIFTRLQRSRTIDFLDKLGIKLRNTQNQFIGPYKAIEQLSQALNDIPNTDPRYAQVLEELGGFRQISKVIPLIQEFATAQKALSIAQLGQNSLTIDAARANESFALQIQKVTENFHAMIREFSNSQSLKSLLGTILKISNAIIEMGKNIEPILPSILSLVGTKLVNITRQSYYGFTGAGQKKFTGFSSGGLVPGRGNRDTVPAMLTPGEYVLKQSAVRSIGVDKLAKLNRYASGGKVRGLSAQDLYNMMTDKKLGKPSKEDATEMREAAKKYLTEVQLSEVEQWEKANGRSYRIDALAGLMLNSGLKIQNRSQRRTEENRAGLPKIGAIFAHSEVGSKTTSRIFDDRIELPDGSVQDYTFHVGMLPDGVWSTVMDGINSDIADIIYKRAIAMNNLLGAVPNESVKKLTSYIPNIQAILGGVFEGIVTSLGAPYDDMGEDANQKRLFDFPSGIGPNLAKVFGDDALADIPVEAKKTYSSFVRQNVREKIFKYFKQMKGFATGGAARGTDTIPAMLTPGEFVINKRSAQKIGYSRLEKANKLGYFAEGGKVGQGVDPVFAGRTFDKLQRAMDKLVDIFDIPDILPKKVTSFVNLLKIVGNDPSIGGVFRPSRKNINLAVPTKENDLPDIVSTFVHELFHKIDLGLGTAIFKANDLDFSDFASELLKDKDLSGARQKEEQFIVNNAVSSGVISSQEDFAKHEKLPDYLAYRLQPKEILANTFSSINRPVLDYNNSTIREAKDVDPKEIAIIKEMFMRSKQLGVRASMVPYSSTNPQSAPADIQRYENVLEKIFNKLSKDWNLNFGKFSDIVKMSGDIQGALPGHVIKALYTPSDKKINFNENVIDGSTVTELTETLAHELMHYIIDSIGNVDLSSVDITPEMNFGRKWSDQKNDYVDTLSPEFRQYRMQPDEIIANTFGAQAIAHLSDMRDPNTVNSFLAGNAQNTGIVDSILKTFRGGKTSNISLSKATANNNGPTLEDIVAEALSSNTTNVASNVIDDNALLDEISKNLANAKPPTPPSKATGYLKDVFSDVDDAFMKQFSTIKDAEEVALGLIEDTTTSITQLAKQHTLRLANVNISQVGNIGTSIPIQQTYGKIGSSNITSTSPIDFLAGARSPYLGTQNDTDPFKWNGKRWINTQSGKFVSQQTVHDTLQQRRDISSVGSFNMSQVTDDVDIIVSGFGDMLQQLQTLIKNGQVALAYNNPLNGPNGPSDIGTYVPANPNRPISSILPPMQLPPGMNLPTGPGYGIQPTRFAKYYEGIDVVGANPASPDAKSTLLNKLTNEFVSLFRLIQPAKFKDNIKYDSSTRSYYKQTGDKISAASYADILNFRKEKMAGIASEELGQTLGYSLATPKNDNQITQFALLAPLAGQIAMQFKDLGDSMKIAIDSITQFSTSIFAFRGLSRELFSLKYKEDKIDTARTLIEQSPEKLAALSNRATKTRLFSDSAKTRLDLTDAAIKIADSPTVDTAKLSKLSADYEAKRQDLLKKKNSLAANSKEYKETIALAKAYEKAELQVKRLLDIEKKREALASQKAATGTSNAAEEAALEAQKQQIFNRLSNRQLRLRESGAQASALADAREANISTFQGQVKGAKKFLGEAALVEQITPMVDALSAAGVTIGNQVQQYGLRKLKSGQGGTNEYITGSTIEGVALGAQSGGSLGMLIGGPIGLAIGAALGGAASGLGSFISATEEAANMVRQLEFDRVYKTFSKTIDSIANDEKNLFGNIGLGMSQFNAAYSRYASSSGDTRQNIKGELSSSSVSLETTFVKIINELAKGSDNLATIFGQFNSVIGQRTLEQYANISGQNVSDVRKQFFARIEDSIRLQSKHAGFTAGKNNVDAFIDRLSIADSTMGAAARAMERLNTSFSLLTSSTVNYSNSLDDVQDITKITRSEFGAITRGANFGGQFAGQYGNDLQNVAAQAFEAIQRLPAVLKGSLAAGGLAGSGLDFAILDYFKKAGFDSSVTSSIGNVIAEVIGADLKPEHLAKALIEDFAGTSKRFSDALSGLISPILRFNQFATQALQAQAKIYEQKRASDEKILEASQKEVDIRQSMYDKIADAVGTDPLDRAKASQQFSDARQTNILGQYARLANNPVGMGNEIQLSNQIIQDLNQAISAGNKDVNVGLALNQEIEKRDRLVKALQFLTDTTNTTAVAQAKLSKEVNAARVRTEIIDTKTFGTFQEKIDQGQVLDFTRQVSSNFDAETIPEEFKRKVESLLKSIGDSSLSEITGNLTGKQVLERTRYTTAYREAQSYGLQGQAAIDYATTQAKPETAVSMQQAIQDFVDANQKSIDANETLKQLYVDENQKFLQGLASTFSTFISEMKIIFLKEEQQKLQKQADDLAAQQGGVQRKLGLAQQVASFLQGKTGRAIGDGELNKLLISGKAAREDIAAVQGYNVSNNPFVRSLLSKQLTPEDMVKFGGLTATMTGIPGALLNLAGSGGVAAGGLAGSGLDNDFAESKALSFLAPRSAPAGLTSQISLSQFDAVLEQFRKEIGGDSTSPEQQAFAADVIQKIRDNELTRTNDGFVRTFDKTNPMTNLTNVFLDSLRQVSEERKSRASIAQKNLEELSATTGLTTGDLQQFLQSQMFADLTEAFDGGTISFNKLNIEASTLAQNLAKVNTALNANTGEQNNATQNMAQQQAFQATLMKGLQGEATASAQQLASPSNQDNLRRFASAYGGPNMLRKDTFGNYFVLTKQGIVYYNPAQRYQTGGYIDGTGSGDKVPSLLEPGEYVLNRNAVRRIGLSNLDSWNNNYARFQTGGLVGSSVKEKIVARDAMLEANEAETIKVLVHEQLNASIEKFSSAANSLATAMNNFPREISMSATHRVEVVVNGAQVLQNIMPEVTKLVVEETKGQINKMLKTKFPTVGPM